MKQILIRAPEHLKDQLQGEASQKGLTMNALVLQILHEHLSKKCNSLIYQRRNHEPEETRKSRV